MVFTIKTITKNEMNVLVKNGIIRNTRKGFINKSGFVIGYYRTRTKRYIEDKYVDMAKKLL